MSGQHIKQFSFTRGEISPSLWQRSDMELYYAGLKKCLNMVPDHKGRLHRRPGTCYLANTKGNKPACFIPFVYNRDQAYMVEATDGCFRFYSDHVQCLDDAGVPIETAVPYTYPDVCELEYTQSGDKLYIVHENYPPACLQRTGAKSFSYEVLKLVGPFGKVNADQSCKIGYNSSNSDKGTLQLTDGVDSCDVGDTLIANDEATGTNYTFVITADQGGGLYETSGGGAPAGNFKIVGKNLIPVSLLDNYFDYTRETGAFNASGCEPFTDEMVGCHIRILDERTNTWVVAEITGVTNSGQVEVDFSGNTTMPNTDLWVISEFCEGNYPETVWIHQDRLWFGNSGNNATGIWGSETGNYNSFLPSDPDGTVNPSNAIYADVNNGTRDEVRWLWSFGRNLMFGTQTGFGQIFGTGNNSGIGADSFDQSFEENYGVADRRPVQVGGILDFIDRARTKLYGAQHGGEYGTLSAFELTLTADHIGACKFDKLTWQEHPYSIVWTTTDDGRLHSLTQRSEQQVYGWASHELGGRWREGGSCYRDPFVEDVETIPGPFEDTDDVYMIVKRTVNGKEVRFVEVMKHFYDCQERCGTDPHDAWHLDAALKYEGNTDKNIELTLSSVGNGKFGAVFATSSLPWTSPPELLAVNDGTRWNYFTSEDSQFCGVWPNTAELEQHGVTYSVTKDCEIEPTQAGCWLDEPEYHDCEHGFWHPPCAETSWRWSQSIRTLLKLDHLEGEKILVHGNGRCVGEFEVQNGEIQNVGNPLVVALAGYPYESCIEMLPPRLQLQGTDGTCDPQYSPEICVYIQCGRDMESGTGGKIRKYKTMRDFETMDLDHHQIEFPYQPLRLQSGWMNKNNIGGGVNDGHKTQIAIRTKTGFPLIISSIEGKWYGSSGR